VHNNGKNRSEFNIYQEITYPNQVRFNTVTEVMISVSNNSDITWDYIRIGVHGNEEYFYKDSDYFKEFDASSSDIQFISSGTVSCHRRHDLVSGEVILLG